MIPPCFVEFVPPPRRPGLVGVYILLLADVPVYVGQTTDLEQRIRSHHARKSHRYRRHRRQFDRVAWFAVEPSEHDAYEGALARALNPRYTKRVSSDKSRDVEILALLGIPADETRAFERRVDEANRKQGKKLRRIMKRQRRWRADKRNDRVRAFVEAA